MAPRSPRRPVPKLIGTVGDLTFDLIEETSLDVSLSGGTSTRRKGIVEGLDGPPEARLTNALRAAGVPLVGDFHPHLPIIVLRLSAQLAESSPSKAYVTVEYGVPQAGPGAPENDPDDEGAAPTIEIISTVQTVTTNFDVDGEPLVVGYIIEDQDAGTSTPDEQIAEGQVQIPLRAKVFKRLERNDPSDKSKRFVGHVNAAEVYGDPPRTWLCTRLDGVSNDGGLSYEVTYEFQQSPNMGPPKDIFGASVVDGTGRISQGWDSVFAYHGSDGKIPKDVMAGDGIRLYRMYPEAEFHRLRGIPFA